jgi:hypothetical protein
MSRSSDAGGELGKSARAFLICVERATVRSVSVSITDEGGFAGAAHAEREEIFEKLAEQIDRLRDCRVLIRFANEEGSRVTLATTNLHTGLPELLIRF